MENIYSNSSQITYSATPSVFLFVFLIFYGKFQNKNDFGPLSFLEAEWWYISPFNIIF